MTDCTGTDYTLTPVSRLRMILGTQVSSYLYLAIFRFIFLLRPRNGSAAYVRSFNAPPAITYVLDDPKLRLRYFFSLFFIVFSTHELFL